MQELDYLEALLQTLEDTLDGKFEWQVEGATKEDMRKAIQIAILKGMRKSTQPNHQMTPDTLGLLVSHFVEQCFEKELAESSISIMEPAFVVRTKEKGKYETVGIAYYDQFIPDASVVEKKGVPRVIYSMLPMFCQDVMNDQGLYVEVNMRYSEYDPMSVSFAI